jgi:ketosteroid isomerase-like protein
MLMMATPQVLQTDEEEVLAANRAFYAALHNLDMPLMAQAWLHTDWVKCMHPGWDLLMGWDEIQASWENIFRSTDRMMVSISRPLVRVAGDVAWVACLEHVTVAQQNNLSTALVEATNIFLRREGRWLLVHRHTTPLVSPSPDATTTVQ